MFEINFEKIYSKSFKNEPFYIGFPMPKGELNDIKNISVCDENKCPLPIQAKATAYWDDGSIKWVFLRSIVNLPANKAVKYYCNTNSVVDVHIQNAITTKNFTINNGELSVSLSTDKNVLFDSVSYCNLTFGNDYIMPPMLKTQANGLCDFKIGKWEYIECGELCVIVCGYGKHTSDGIDIADFKVTLTFYADKSWFDMSYCITNTTDNDIEINDISIDINCNSENAEYCTGISNYKTRFDIGKNGEDVRTAIDAEFLKFESNEHNPEVFYGTFFADHSNNKSGICATVFQAQQNIPKAISATKGGIRVQLVPEDMANITLLSGMARQQRLQLHFHKAFEDLQEINNRSIVYQMPNRPAISPEIFKRSGIFENIFTENKIPNLETFLIGKADEHSRCYGMLNWGDSPDGGYTAQGRGGGKMVWSNNEYDFPHACMLMYIRTGIRRYMDYILVTARHWVDVDVCHYSRNPLLMGGQYEHTRDHIVNGVVVCSHQWVEGLLDCYHLTGDKEYFDTAIGIGNNVLRLLEQPVFQHSGQANARETGWALRTLSALYKETNDKKWLEKCNWIVGHFKEWEQEYGLWLAPYTDNSAIRVVFMISIAACSLMRYYRIDPQPEIKDMILRAVDDLVENARLDNGLFYYKELPSLKRLGNNPIILEALTYAYELTGNTDYLQAGLPTFEYIQSARPSIVAGGGKQVVEDSLLCGGIGTKSFAQMMIPFTTFYTACTKEGLL